MDTRALLGRRRTWASLAARHPSAPCLPAITKEQISETADQIAAAGQTPTLAAVRKAVGGGSFTTISGAMADR